MKKIMNKKLAKRKRSKLAPEEIERRKQQREQKKEIRDIFNVLVSNACWVSTAKSLIMIVGQVNLMTFLFVRMLLF